MKCYSATRRRDAAEVSRRGVVAVGRPHAAAFEIVGATVLVLMFAVATAGPLQAQDAGKDDSSWEKIDSVLVLPPVLHPAAESAPADACAQDCPGSSAPSDGEAPRAVVGTADNPTDESVAVGGLAPDGSDLQDSQQTAAAGGGDPQSDNGLDDSLGSTGDYQAQQAAAEAGGYGIVQAPPVIVAAPIGPYRGPSYAPRTLAPMPPVFAPARSMPTSPAWMPPPMTRVAPLSPMIGPGFPPTAGGFPGAFYGSSGGIFQNNMSGFRAGFGRR
jgi:hypothetical protein